MKKMNLPRMVVTAFLLLNAIAVSYANETRRIISYEKVELKNAVPALSFNGDQPVFEDSFFNLLRQKINGLGDYRNLLIEVVGHSDNAPMTAASRAKWGSNQNLSQVGAENAVSEIQKRVNFPGTQFAAKGVGDSRPLVPNDTPENQAKNRRGEVNFYYEKPVYEKLAATPQANTQFDQAKEALAQTAEDEDANTLEEALTAVDENYSLIKQGQFGLQYGYNFTYSSVDALVSDPASDNDLRGVARDSRFTHASTISTSYGLKNNLTLGLNLPLISTVRSSGSVGSEVEDTGIGDLGMNLRWQPWPLRLGKPNVTFSSSLSLPTGSDPFEINPKNSVVTGGGLFGLSLAANASKTIDPVIAYGSVSLGYSLPRDDLNQERDNGKVLVSVKPRPTFSYNVGIGYALSYGVSINMGFQHTFGSRTVLGFADGTDAEARESVQPFESVGGHSALFNISTGFRTSPGTVFSINLGIGLTRESPDFLIGFSLPFSVEGLKRYFVDDE